MDSNEFPGPRIRAARIWGNNERHVRTWWSLIRITLLLVVHVVAYFFLHRWHESSVNDVAIERIVLICSP